MEFITIREVIDELEAIVRDNNLSLSIPPNGTLRRWTNNNVISSPAKIINIGNRGRMGYYPAEVVTEILTAKMLLEHGGLKVAEIAQARNTQLELQLRNTQLMLQVTKKLIEDGEDGLEHDQAIDKMKSLQCELRMYELEKERMKWICDQYGKTFQMMDELVQARRAQN